MTIGLGEALAMVAHAKIPLPMDKVAAFCARWGVKEFALFGSVLRDDFGPASDIDVLLTFVPGSAGITFDNRPDILAEVRAMFPGREVDVVERDLITNPFRRAHILRNHRVIHAA